MKFWETMTIKEMELLLKRRKEPGIQEGWNELAQKIDNDRYPNRDRFYSLERQILSSCPMVPAAYFFFCVAVSVQQNCETAPDLREVTLARNEIAKMAARDLPEFCTKTGAMSVLRPVFVGEPPYSIPVFPINMALRELFNALAEDNRKRWEKGLELQAEDDQKKLTAEHGAQKNLEYGLDNLERELNQWDNTCRSMWETALAAQEEPPSQDAPPEEPVPEEPHAEDALLKQQEQERRRTECERLREENETFRAAFQLIQAGVRQIIFTGAPGTGKTYTAGLLAENMGMGWTLPEYWEKLKADREIWKRTPSYPLVQFHPSYDYTDFVEGLRPVEMDERPTFVKLDGSFKAFCRQVAEQNEAETEGENLYFFLIDEINRADLSKVFGELMFCLETDKRGRPVQTQYRNLPTYAVDQETRRAASLSQKDDVFVSGFFIPRNVVILGTMNDIDRSVESMDFALRRRFEWREVEVTDKLLVQAFQSGSSGACLQKNASEAARRIMMLNRVISGGGSREGGRFGLNRHYYISQGQFAHLPDTQKDSGSLDELIRYVWDYRIKSLLQEYVRGEDEAAVGAFLESCWEALGTAGQSHA